MTNDPKYCVMRINKFTAVKAMDAAYRHVYREEMPLNADPSLSHNNIHDVHEVDGAGTQLTYNESFSKRISQLDYYKNHNIRKNAVRGFDVLLSYSKNAEGTFDRQAWIKRNAEWLNKNFSKAPDGRSNVISVVYHEDEQSFHGHAFIIPIDERGRLNSRRFINGTLGQLQSSYAEAMKEFGLERGIEGSTADHQTMSKLYAKANKAATLSKPREGESALDYYNRIQQEAMEMNLQMYQRTTKKLQRDRAKFDREKQQALKLLEHESAMIKKDNAHEMQETENKIQSAYQKLHEIQDEYATLAESFTAKGLNAEEVLNGYSHYKKLQLGLEKYENESPEQASQLASIISTIETAGRNYETEKKSFNDITR